MTVFLSLLFFSWGQNLNLPYSVLEGKRTYGKKNFKRKAKIHTHQESQELCLSSINLTDGSFNQESQELCLSSINLTDRSFKSLLSLCSEFMQFALPVVSSFFFFFFPVCLFYFLNQKLKTGSRNSFSMQKAFSLMGLSWTCLAVTTSLSCMVCYVQMGI